MEFEEEGLSWLKKRLHLGLLLLLAAAASLQAQFSVLPHFAGPAADGQSPYGSLIRKGAAFYGMIGAADGAMPYGSPTPYYGTLSAMTGDGGNAGFGNVFSYKIR